MILSGPTHTNRGNSAGKAQCCMPYFACSKEGQALTQTIKCTPVPTLLRWHGRGGGKRQEDFTVIQLGRTRNSCDPADSSGCAAARAIAKINAKSSAGPNWPGPCETSRGFSQQRTPMWLQDTLATRVDTPNSRKDCYRKSAEFPQYCTVPMPVATPAELCFPSSNNAADGFAARTTFPL